MSTRGKILLASIVFCAMVWSTLLLAAAPAPKDPTLLTWVHVWGCPRPTSDVVLIFSNGQVVRLRVDTLSDEDKQKLVKSIGDVEGVNIQYKCGTEV